MSRTPITLNDRTLRLSQLENERYPDGKKAYEKHLAKLQQQMLRIQQAYYHQGRRAVLAFEGWDAAGKGGTIRLLTAMLDPRGFHVYPIAAPNPEDQAKHYMYRFWNRLPLPGQLAIFDRTWYGRVLVERIEGFASRDAWGRAYAEINDFERTLVDDGARVVKVFLHISAKEQRKRFSERLHNPLKRWKLTAEDLRNMDKRSKYNKALHDMFDRTDTKHAPWHVVMANHKWYVRIAVLELVIEALGAGVDVAAPIADPKFIKAALKALG